ncbi:MAG: hypothetical protein OJF60_003485 [Burkholderiaceae bacterium]|nr:MAG: hypothetical protein OJF60_003485 [Burkholderiaceae bacterium]
MLPLKRKRSCRAPEEKPSSIETDRCASSLTNHRLRAVSRLFRRAATVCTLSNDCQCGNTSSGDHAVLPLAARA